MRFAVALATIWTLGVFPALGLDQDRPADSKRAPAASPQRPTPVNPAPSTSGRNDTVGRTPAPPAQTYPNGAQKSAPIDPSAFGWAFGHIDTVYTHPAPPSPVPRPRHCHGPSCGTCPAHWEWRQQAVWVPGYWYQKFVPARYEYRLVNGFAVWQLVQAEHYENVFMPGYYEWRPVRVWVRATWACGY